MHRVIKAYLADFERSFSVSEDEAKCFEAFVSYSIFKSLSADTVNPRDLVYEGDDPGIDSVLFFVDDTYVSSPEEVDDALKGRRRDCEAIVIFVQTKTFESWDKKEVNNFASGVKDFLNEVSVYPHGEWISERKEIFNKLIENVGKLKGGKPVCRCYFATTAREASDREVLSAFRALKRDVEETGLLRDVRAEPLGREEVGSLWKAAEGPVETTLPVIGVAPFPKTPGVEQGYVVTVKAKEFVNNILIGENGKFRQRIFEENVRDFVGLENSVNKEITKTVMDEIKQKRFGILNNGVTIISQNIKMQPLQVALRDFQIVNGCQTSNVLFKLQEQLSDDATIMLKIVETTDQSVIDDVVRSTNRQTTVEDEQFLATLDCVKGIEDFFNARGPEDTHRIYFERRRNQFHEHQPSVSRIFDVKQVARCVSAMFLDKPDLASRYPNRLTGEQHKSVFKKEIVQEVYYTATYSLYRLLIYLNSGRIDRKYTKLRWHILMAIKYYLADSSIPSIESVKIKRLCSKIESYMSSTEDGGADKIHALCSTVFGTPDITRDTLKGQTFVEVVKEKSIAARKSMSGER